MSTTPRRTRPPLLHIYLNDHLAGATGGVDLAKRLARNHHSTPAGPVLARFAREVAEDRRSLLRIMAALGADVQRYKLVIARAGEKVGRFKLNGYLLRRSPLSSVEELEAMRIGVEGKADGWRTLLTVADGDPRLDVVELETLLARAIGQSVTLQELRTASAAEVFSPIAV
jgi:hypothetical protein